MASHQILIIDDERHLRNILKILLTGAGYGAVEAADGEEGLRLADETDFDAVLCDINMPGIDGLTVLRRIKAGQPELPVIMITAFASVDTAVEAMKLGASDYVSKPFNEDQILIVLAKALEQRRILAENRRLKQEVSDKFDFSSIITASPKMTKVLETAAKVIDTKSTILIQGESGTGKELLAKMIHYNSPRQSKPFVAVNCGAIPESLMESEFFGHVKGAFTGADRAKEGLFRAADGGTLFLDEIGELPVELQVKLLRVIQEEEVRPVGSSQSVKIDVRLLAATNQKLEAMVERREFREDLFYRLAVIRLQLPPLRERPEDPPLLANHFLVQLAEKHNRPKARFTAQALQHMSRLPWRGNIRELMNVVEQSLLLSDGPEIGTDYLPPAPQGQPINGDQPSLQLPAGVMNLKETVADLTRRAEMEIIGRALEAAEGNRTKAADLMGISRRSLQLKIKEYDL